MRSQDAGEWGSTHASRCPHMEGRTDNIASASPQGLTQRLHQCADELISFIFFAEMTACVWIEHVRGRRRKSLPGGFPKAQVLTLTPFHSLGK